MVICILLLSFAISGMLKESSNLAVASAVKFLRFLANITWSYMSSAAIRGWLVNTSWPDGAEKKIMDPKTLTFWWLGCFTMPSRHFFSIADGNLVVSCQPRNSHYDHFRGSQRFGSHILTSLRNLTALAVGILLLSFTISGMLKESSNLAVASAVKFLW